MTFEFFHSLHERIAKTGTSETSGKFLATARQASGNIITAREQADQNGAWTGKGDGWIREDSLRGVCDHMVSVVLSLRVFDGMGTVTGECIAGTARR